MKKSVKLVMLLTAIMLLSMLNGCADKKIAATDEPAPPVPVRPQPVSAQITAVGDFLMHMPVINAAWNDKLNRYDFASQLTEIKPFLSEPDLTIANLETRLAGKENNGYSGYPLFNCPEQLAYDLKEVGVDVVTTANNHSLDRGFNGLVKTLDNLQTAGLLTVGNYRTPEERVPLLLDVNSIKTGILNYTESVNGIPVPPGKEYAIDFADPHIIAQDIAEMRELGADVIIVYLHFGVEYQRHPSQQQRELVDKIFAAGADIIFGDHVHVIQPMEKKKITFQGKEKEVFVIYSLGNFISNQRWQYSDSGVIVNVVLQKDVETNETIIKKVDYIPTWVHTYQENGKMRYRVVAVEKAIKDYEQQKDKTISPNDYRRLKEVWQETTTHLTDQEQEIYPQLLITSDKPTEYYAE